MVGAITHAFSLTVADGPDAGVVRPTNWNAPHVQMLTIEGNTLGASTLSGENIVLAGGANITLSIAGSTVSIQGGAGGAGDGGVGLSAGANSVSTGTVVFSNSNGISFGLNGSTVTASHNALTTARASNDAVGLNTAQSNVTWTINSAGLSLDARGYAGTVTGATNASVTANSNGVSVSVGPYITTARASTDAIGLNTALTAGPLAWTVNSAGLSLNAGSAAGTTSGFGGNLISGSMTHNTAGLNLSLNHPAWLTTAMLSNAATISNIRVSAGTTSNLLSAITFSNANGITFGLDASTVTASHNGLTSQSNQNVTAGNGGFAFQTLSFSNVNGISFGTSAGSAITASHNGLTTARASTDGIGLNTAQTNVTWTVNSSGLSLNAAGYAGTGTTFNGANVSGSMTVNSVGVQLSLSAGAGGGETRLTAYAVSNTTQSTSGTIPLSSLQFHGAGIASVGVSNGSVIVSVPAGGGAGDGGVFAGVSNLGNTAGSTGTVSTGNFVLVGSNGISLSQSTGAAGSAATITINGIPPGTATMWWPFNEGINVSGSHGQATWQICPVPTPPTAANGEVQIDRLCIPMLVTNSSNSTGSATISYWFGLYTRTESSISLAHSTTGSLAVTFSGTVNNSTYAGIRLATIPWTTTIGDGRYYVAVASRTTTGGGNCTIVQMLNSQLNSNFSGLYGANSNRSHQWPLGMGVYSASSTAFPNSIAFSQIDGSGSLGIRSPSWHMINGTA